MTLRLPHGCSFHKLLATRLSILLQRAAVVVAVAMAVVVVLEDCLLHQLHYHLEQHTQLQLVLEVRDR
jgi:hypothetical protein